MLTNMNDFILSLDAPGKTLTLRDVLFQGQQDVPTGECDFRLTTRHCTENECVTKYILKVIDDGDTFCDE